MTVKSEQILPNSSSTKVGVIDELLSSADVYKKFCQKLTKSARFDISGISGSLTSFLIKRAFRQTGESILVAAP